MSIETFFTCMKGIYERKVSIKLNLSAKVFNLLKESIPAYSFMLLFFAWYDRKRWNNNKTIFRIVNIKLLTDNDAHCGRVSHQGTKNHHNKNDVINQLNS